MKITFKASRLIESLGFVSIVEPSALTNQQNSTAYLFKCARDEYRRPIAHVYSRGGEKVARAGFELHELEGEGLFTMPCKHADLIREIPDDTVTIESRTENKPDGEAFFVSLRSASGMKYEHTTYDPRLISPCDKDFDAARRNGAVEYNVGLLREAFRKARPFLPDATRRDVGEHFNTIQIFDASNPDWARGGGFLFCSDASRAFYFESEEFRNKGLALHLKHVPALQAFLSRCHGVTIYRGTNLSFAVNADRSHERDQVLGWHHDTRTHTRFAYYSLSRDTYVVIAPKRELLDALEQVEMLLDRNRDRVKLVYTHRNPQTGGHTLHFEYSESAGKIESTSVQTADKTNEPSLEEDCDYFVNAKFFRSLVEEVVGPMVELRICPIPKDDVRRGGAMFRTIEEIEIAGDDVVAGGRRNFRCRVTRFMPSTF